MKKLLLLSIALSVFAAASVDINKASVKELTTLKGIGEKKAEAIVAYREQVHCFKKAEELTNVKGIGKKTVEKNKNEITIGECKQ